MRHANIGRILKGTFARNVITVAGGTAAAQFLALLSSPIIARLYGAEAFGILGVYTALISILAPVAAGAYPNAIALAAKDSEAQSLSLLSVGLGAIFSTLLAVAIQLAPAGYLNALGLSDLGPLLLLVPLTIMFDVFTQTAQQSAYRTGKFRLTARAAILHAASTNSLKIVAGFLSPTGGALVRITVLGQAIHTLLYLPSTLRVRRQVTRLGRKLFTLSRVLADLRTTARKFVAFPRYRAPEYLMSAMAQSIPTILLATFFGAVAAGYFALARTIVTLPGLLIARSVGDVLYPKLARVAQEGGVIRPYSLQATRALSALGVLPFGALITLGPWFFSIIFGVDWVPAGQYAQWMSLWLFSAFCARPSVVLIPVLEIQRFHLLYSLVSTVSRISALWLGYVHFGTDLAAVALFSITGVAANCFLILYVHAKAAEFDRTRDNRI